MILRGFPVSRRIKCSAPQYLQVREIIFGVISNFPPQLGQVRVIKSSINRLLINHLISELLIRKDGLNNSSVVILCNFILEYRQYVV